MKKIIMLMSILFIFCMQGVFANSIEQVSTENSNSKNTVRGIPGTTKKIFTRTETKQVNQYTDNESGQSYTYEKSRQFIRSYVKTTYI